MAAGPHHEAEKLLRLDQFPHVKVEPFQAGAICAWHIRHVRDDSPGAVLELEPRPAYFAMIYLRPVTHCDLLRNGEALSPKQYDEGSICLVDLSEGAAIRLSTELDGIGLVVPFSLVDEIASRFPQLRILPRPRRNSPDMVPISSGLPFCLSCPNMMTRPRPHSSTSWRHSASSFWPSATTFIDRLSAEPVLG